MGEAEGDPDTPRISPFKFISRPNLKGDSAQASLEKVDSLITQAHQNSSGSGGATIEVIIRMFSL